MARQNRVLPTGEIVALPVRGLFMGNRGILHDAEGRLGAARWRHRAWICCRLCFKGRRRPVMVPGSYTELFFLDEAVALAAGHRPCAECRREDYLSFRSAWERAFGSAPAAPEIDQILHAARLEPHSRTHRRHTAALADLPDGAFILHQERPHLVRHDRLHPVTDQGYGPGRPRPRAGDAVVLTPAPLVAVLAAGYRPSFHPDAR